MEQIVQTPRSRLYPWLLAIRPKTLAASLAPVFFSGWLAWHSGRFNPYVFLLILITATLIQIGTNLINDLSDFKKGADTSERKGPIRVTQAGLISVDTITKAAYGTLGLALLCGVYLVFLGGTPILLIGIASLLSAWCYTAGPYPLAYLGIADIFVLIFFGPVATTGTYLLLTQEFSLTALLTGVGFGAISTAILVVNNLRDVEEDKAASKRTTAVRFGRGFARAEYLVLLAIATIAVPATLLRLDLATNKIWITALIIIFTLPLIRTIYSPASAEELNRCLAATAKLLFVYALLVALGLT